MLMEFMKEMLKKLSNLKIKKKKIIHLKQYQQNINTEKEFNYLKMVIYIMEIGQMVRWKEWEDIILIL